MNVEIERPAGAGRLEMGQEIFRDVMDPTPLMTTVKVADFNGDGLKDIGILLSDGSLEIYLQEQVEKDPPSMTQPAP